MHLAILLNISTSLLKPLTKTVFFRARSERKFAAKPFNKTILLCGAVFILISNLAISEKVYAIGCDGWIGSPSQTCYQDPIAALTERCGYYEDLAGENGQPTFWQFYNLRQTNPGRFDTYCDVYRFSPTSGNYVRVSIHSASTPFSACEPPFKRVSTGGCVLSCPYGVEADGQSCKPPKPDKECDKTNNPINFVSGHKLREEVDYETSGLNNLHFTRYYNSQNNMQRKSEAGWQPTGDAATYYQSETISRSAINSPQAAQLNSPMIEVKGQTFEYYDGVVGEMTTIDAMVYILRNKPLGNMNKQWRHNFDKALYQNPQLLTKVIVYRANGDDLHFNRVGQTNEYITDRSLSGLDTLYEMPFHWLYLTAAMDKEYYDLQGRLTSIETKNGYTQTFTYDANDLLTGVADSLGRTLAFTYDEYARMVTMTDPDGNVYTYTYGMNTLLDRVYYPDEDGDGIYFNNPHRRYVYEDPRFPEALTGIFDNGVRYATFAYQANGFAISSELANGAERVEIDYSVANQRKLTNAFGKNTIYHMDSSNTFVTSIEGEASPNCAADLQTIVYDSNKFKISETDRNGNVTTYTRDNKGREISRTEAFGTAQARTIQTEWDPLNNLPERIIEPERITEFTYDANGLLLNKTVTPVAP